MRRGRYEYPELVGRVIAFDIGQGPFITSPSYPLYPNQNWSYMGDNAKAWFTQDSGFSIGSARWWRAPCLPCATWHVTAEGKGVLRVVIPLQLQNSAL